MKKKLLVVASALAMLAVFALPASAGHSWNGYKWAGTGGDLGLQLVDHMSGKWSGLLGPVLDDWDVDDPHNTFALSATPGRVLPFVLIRWHPVWRRLPARSSCATTPTARSAGWAWPVSG